jgi:outer membrane protein assembly factor BamB
VNPHRLGFSVVLAFAVLTLWQITTRADDSWPQWRGPGGQGIAAASGLPTEWSESKNVTWRAVVPGRGWSSPVVAKGKVWMTTAIDRPATKEEIKERLKSNTGGQPLNVAAEVSLRAVCIDLKTGKLLHNVEVLNRKNPQWIHALNSYASPTPVLDGDRLYCHFGDYGTACLDTTTAKVLWTNRETRVMHENGPGSSPVLWKNRLIFHCDGSDVQYVAALDTKTGKLAWKTKRSGKMNANPQLKKSYSTPLVARLDGHDQLISPGSDWLYSYDPATGKELWKLKYGFLGFSIVPRPLVSDDTIYLCTSYMKSQLLAIRFEAGSRKPYIAWKATRQVPNRPSPILVDGRIYMIHDNGVATCLNAKTGAQIWQERISGKYSASPTYADGKIFLHSQEGKTTVLAPGDRLKVLATNILDGRLMASAAVVDGALLLRSDKALYRIEAK